jgi:hypothetical protein
MIKTKLLSVGTSAILASERETIDSIRGQSVVIHNDSAITVYAGGSDVTVLDGLPIPQSSTVTFELNHPQDLFLIAGSATNVRVLIEGLR